MNLNDSQQQAINHKTGPCLVLAGPGSGKTFTLTNRIKKLIDDGISANKILVITFTKAAAMEMKERFDKLSDTVYPVTFGTFHSLFWGILQLELKLRSDSIIMGERRDSIIKEAVKKSDITVDSTDYYSLVTSEISLINNTNIPIDNYVSKNMNTSDIRKIYQCFKALKRKYRVLDFDDMLILAYELFMEKPEILKKWQNRFEYFLIDEMQDMNPIQYELILMLSAGTNNIFAVGDDDQSIYDFRGADPKMMLQFENGFSNTKRILLDTNYRCPENIVQMASNVISNNKLRFEKNIKAVNKDGTIQINKCKDCREEAKTVLEKIHTIKNSGKEYDSCAVLYRNHSEAGFIINELITSDIPFFLKDKMPNIFNHFIFNDFESYFQIAIGNSTRARLLQVMNRPNRYIVRQALEQGSNTASLKAFYSGNEYMLNRIDAFERDMNLISKMRPFAAVNYIKNIIGYDDFLKELSIKQNVEYGEYASVVELFIESVKECKNLKQAIDTLNSLKLKIEYENRSKNVDKKGKVGLYTLHSSKGLEFENVFIIGTNEGVIPSKKAVTESQLEAERRLFYVGITRSKSNLYISYLNEKNRDRLYPSRFINELNVSNYSSSPKASS